MSAIAQPLTILIKHLQRLTMVPTSIPIVLAASGSVIALFIRSARERGAHTA